MAIIHRRQNEAGIAMITTLLVMMLVSALLVGFTAVIMSDQRFRFIDRDRSQAFYGAQAGLEKLTADLGNLFFTNVAPTSTQVQALTTNTPTITGVQFLKSDDTSGYLISAVSLGSQPIMAGPYAGLSGLVTKYTIDVTARTGTRGEVHLQRVTETVAIPVFQFGMFSDVDLSFSAADDFDFGGRVHTNGNLFLAEGAGNNLVMRDKVTAVGEVVRKFLSNGNSITNSGSTGTVQIATTSGGCVPSTSASCRALATTEGSVTDGPLSLPLNEPTWHTISQTTYNGNLRNARTGAKVLALPLVTIGGTNLDLVKRPAVSENTTNSILYGERFFSKASIRILLSDTAADITTLPTVTSTAPVWLDGDWATTVPNNGTAYGPIDAAHPPIARSVGPNATTTTGATTTLSTTINVTNNAGALWFKPVLRIGASNVTCTIRDSANDRFQGCVGTPAAANGAAVTSAGGSATTLSAALAAGATTINVAGATNWANFFVAQPFWLNDRLVQCNGDYTATQFSGCAGLPTSIVGATITSSSLSTAGTGTIGGYIKVELQNSAGVWSDVTMQVLNFGIGGPNLGGARCGGATGDPTPNAILRIQRLRDNQGTAGGNGGGCASYLGTTVATDYWPNVLFDTREALFRDTSPGGTDVVLGGVMHYIALDVRNLSLWLAGTVAPYTTALGATGNTAVSNNGYTVYFSDRRNNRNASNVETGEYGYEDFVNPATGGVPNGILDVGEDLNGNNVLDTYGQFPRYTLNTAVGAASSVPPGAAAPLDAAARPLTTLGPGEAQVNRAILYRRALKLINGAFIGNVGQIIAPGLTVATENPIYIQGDFNASNNGFDTAVDIAQHEATSIIADSATMLSNNWNDNNSFTSPYAASGRARAQDTYFRVAILAGKGRIFPLPSGAGATFGTDGGAHSFLRFLEGDGPSPDTIHYRGSLATFYFSRQGVSPFKCCNGIVYSVPTRDYAFDLDFLDPAKLPPLTPVFRDLNTIGFAQETRPGR